MEKLLTDTVFPVAVRQAVNYLWKLCRPLREIAAVEPIRVQVSEAKILIQLSEEGQKAIQAAIALQQAGGGGGVATPLAGVEIYLADSDSVGTYTIVIIG
jgi:hypothetical protein